MEAQRKCRKALGKRGCYRSVGKQQRNGGECSKMCGEALGKCRQVQGSTPESVRGTEEMY